MGHLYQLYERQFKRLNANVVRINGPWDTFGRIIKQQENGTYLIRGLGHKEPA